MDDMDALVASIEGDGFAAAKRKKKANKTKKRKGGGPSKPFVINKLLKARIAIALVQQHGHLRSSLLREHGRNGLLQPESLTTKLFCKKTTTESGARCAFPSRLWRV